jgi:hypothetical protein
MRPPIVFALLICAACAGKQSATATAATPSAPPSAGAPDSVRLVEFRIPREVADFRAVHRHDYDNPAAGTRVRYHGPSPLAADVYFYPILPTGLATSDAGRDSAATLEFQQARKDIFDHQARIGGSTPTALGQVVIQAPAGGGRIARGHRASFSYTRDGAMVTSHLYVFGLRDRYMKVRASYTRAEGPSEPPPALEEFVRALLRASAEGYDPG